MCQLSLIHPLLENNQPLRKRIEFHQMDSEAIIYTYGNTSIDGLDLIHILQPYHINCVVDCRPQSYTMLMNNTPSDELQQLLKQHDITYLSFSQHFGIFPNETRNAKGTILYSKIIKFNKFQEGIERLEKGIDKGYTICIIDQEREVCKSIRYTFIGRFLKEKYNIYHIYLDGLCYDQNQVEIQQTKLKHNRQQKNLLAQKIGENGEELAALYLTNHGYQIIDHNWNLHRGCELDLIAMKDNILHFIEVKTRSSDQYGEPQSAINWIKMNHICNAIHQYRYRRGFQSIHYQIDSIAIIYREENDYDLKHFLDIRPDGSACADVIVYNQRPHSDH